MKRWPFALAVVLALAVLGLQVAAAMAGVPKYAALYRDMNWFLDWRTELVLSPWSRAAWCAWTALGIAAALLRPVRGRRGATLAGTVGVAVAASATMLWALLLPFFDVFNTYPALK